MVKRVALVVDDAPAAVALHAKLLNGLGYESIVETRSAVVLDLLERRPDIEVALIDLRMPEMDGLELLRRIRQRQPHVGVLLVTVVNDVEPAIQAIKSGAYNYLLKPLQKDRLRAALDSYFVNRPRRFGDDPRFSGFITGCPVFEPVFRALRAFSEADISVLIQGETGTGKELVAELVHSLSPRASERFVTLNVAALSPTLFESELFGHRRGSFTGATADHTGYLEEAGVGTLFLDEIGEMGEEQQKKLLRVVQRRSYTRVGDTAERPLRARLVLATNRDLRAEVDAGRFRSDLYYRLAGHTIELPPLRDRPGDIPLLSRYLLQKYSSQFGRRVIGVDPEAMAQLEAYPFPGNVRELESIISGAVLLESSAMISLQSLPPRVRALAELKGDDLDSVRCRAIVSALTNCYGNQTRAAEKLGLSRTHLNKVLKRMRERGWPV